MELRTCQDFLKEFRDEMPNPKIAPWTREVCVFFLWDVRHDHVVQNEDFDMTPQK